MLTFSEYLALSQSGAHPPIAWPPAPRAPLPPFPPGHYDHTLPFTPPDKPDKLFYRGNFCGIRAPGVPLLEGMAGYTVPPWNANQPPHCPPFMAQDLPRYWIKGMRDEFDHLLNIYVAVDGYTHLQMSVCHAVEAGFSIDQYINCCGRAREFVPFLDQWFLGGVWGARDMASDYWRPIVTPWMEALIANGLIDCCCVGWQLDHFNTGTPRMVDGRMQSPIQSIIDMFADWTTPREIPLGTHWVNEAGAWNDPFDRFQWWKDQKGKQLWFHHQGDTTMPVDEYQAKLCDTLNPFGDGRMGTSGLFGDRPYSLVVYECSAQSQFDLMMSEDEGDLRGYLLCCTKAASYVGGYGNGARRPDGSVL